MVQKQHLGHLSYRYTHLALHKQVEEGNYQLNNKNSTCNPQSPNTVERSLLLTQLRIQVPERPDQPRSRCMVLKCDHLTVFAFFFKCDSTWTKARAGTTHTVGAGDRRGDGGEGLTEVGTGGGVGVVVGESLTSRRILANCLTFLLYQKCQTDCCCTTYSKTWLLDLVMYYYTIPLLWHCWCRGWLQRPKLYQEQSSHQHWSGWPFLKLEEWL